MARTRTWHQEPGTVTQASPLEVRLDSELTGGPAKALNGATYTVDDRVAVLVRNPQPPLVLGKES